MDRIDSGQTKPSRGENLERILQGDSFSPLIFTQQRIQETYRVGAGFTNLQNHKKKFTALCICMKVFTKKEELKRTWESDTKDKNIHLGYRNRIWY